MRHDACVGTIRSVSQCGTKDSGVAESSILSTGALFETIRGKVPRSRIVVNVFGFGEFSR